MKGLVKANEGTTPQQADGVSVGVYFVNKVVSDASIGGIKPLMIK